jgi:hypothetical protein
MTVLIEMTISLAGISMGRKVYEMPLIFTAASCPLSTLTPFHLLLLSLSLSLDDPDATQQLVWLTDVPSTIEFIAAAEVAIIGFFQVCPDVPLATSP